MNPDFKDQPFYKETDFKPLKGVSMRLDKKSTYISMTKMLGELRSPCLKRHIGCIITNDEGHIKAIGYNGPPKGFPHCIECRRPKDLFPKQLPACPSVHAEANALLQLEDKRFSTILYTTTHPCIECVKLIANTNIKHIYYQQEYNTNPRDKDLIGEILRNARIFCLQL